MSGWECVVLCIIHMFCTDTYISKMIGIVCSFTLLWYITRPSMLCLAVIASSGVTALFSLLFYWSSLSLFLSFALCLFLSLSLSLSRSFSLSLSLSVSLSLSLSLSLGLSVTVALSRLVLGLSSGWPCGNVMMSLAVLVPVVFRLLPCHEV